MTDVYGYEQMRTVPCGNSGPVLGSGMDWYAGMVYADLATIPLKASPVGEIRTLSSHWQSDLEIYR